MRGSYKRNGLLTLMFKITNSRSSIQAMKYGKMAKKAGSVTTAF
jgi:hypothetical protein